MSKSNLVDIACLVIHETDKGVFINDGTRKVWLPKSQVEVAPNPDGKTAVVTMPEWLALENKLI